MVSSGLRSPGLASDERNVRFLSRSGSSRTSSFSQILAGREEEGRQVQVDADRLHEQTAVSERDGHRHIPSWPAGEGHRAAVIVSGRLSVLNGSRQDGFGLDAESPEFSQFPGGQV